MNVIFTGKASWKKGIIFNYIYFHLYSRFVQFYFIVSFKYEHVYEIFELNNCREQFYNFRIAHMDNTKIFIHHLT